MVLKWIRIWLLVVGVLLMGTMGYRYLLEWEWVEALYMTTITMTTVGFAEVRPLSEVGRLFTIVLMLTSVGVFAYSLTTLGDMVVEMHFGSLLWRRRMDKQIKSFSNHTIICGYGRTGRAVCAQMKRSNHPFLVVENNPERIEKLREENFLFVEGDANEDECLRRAGIDRASGLAATLGNDAENVYLVLSARQLNAELTIVSWASSVEAERKVIRAGADRAISPYSLNGQRLALMLLNPHTVDFLEHAMAGSNDIRMGEIHIKKDSKIKGNSLRDLGIKRDLGVVIIGIRRANGKLEFNPSAEEMLLDGDILIGIGGEEQLEKLRNMV